MKYYKKKKIYIYYYKYLMHHEKNKKYEDNEIKFVKSYILLEISAFRERWKFKAIFKNC